MRAFVMGATGSIGAGVVLEMLARGYEVTALSRSDTADAAIRAMGAVPLRGDLHQPKEWAKAAVDHDAIVHTACDAFEDMPAIDPLVTSALLDAAGQVPHRPRLIYTGSCWFYGETGDRIAHEGPPFDTHPSFLWMIESAERLMANDALSTAVLVPGMVYHIDGGVFWRFIASARENEPLAIWGSPNKRWPLIHRDDLARAYCDLIERPQLTGYFNAAVEDGVRVGDIADGIVAAVGSTQPHQSVPVDKVVAKHGAWASGPAIDQRMGADRLRNEADWEPRITDWRRSDLMVKLRG